MHSIPVNFIENEQCEKAFQNTHLGKYFQLHRSFVCALPVTPNHDLCQVKFFSSSFPAQVLRSS